MNAPGIFYPDPNWYAERMGMLTSAKIRDAIKQRKRGEGELASRRKLKMEMLSELLTGNTVDHYVSMAMDWGTETEPKARGHYEYRTGNSVEQVGLVYHPTNKRFGATPDGWVQPNGLLEIKCPETYTHLEYLAGGVVPEEYRDQIDWQMACAGPEIEWVDFVSFDPRIEDDDLKMFVCRRERDDKRIAEMEEQATVFLDEVIQLFEQIKRGAKGQSIEDKLRESVRQARGKYPSDAELGITQEDVMA